MMRGGALVLLLLCALVAALFPCVSAEVKDKEFHLRPGFDETVSVSIVCATK